MMFQIVVTHMLQYVCLLKSHSTLLPDIYDDFSADWLRWERRSYWQLRCLVYDAKKLEQLNYIDVLMVFKVDVMHMLQHVYY